MANGDQSGIGKGRTGRGRRGRWAGPLAEVLEGAQLLATITVNTIGDADGADGSNTLSLRQAIEIANGTLAVSTLTPTQHGLVNGDPTAFTAFAPNLIAFAIPGTGPFTISPSAGNALPVLMTPVIIDGYSQPGASPNTNGPGLPDNAVIQIEINGAQLQTLFGTPSTVAPYYSSGLVLTFNTIVQGLAIDDFNGAVPSSSSVSTPYITGGAIVVTGSNNVIQGDFIGTGLSGNMFNVGSRGAGVLVTPSQIVTIGGTTPAARNVISGNTVNVQTSGRATVQGNFIGTDLTGTKSISSQFSTGVITTLTDTIGGTAAGAGNLISGLGIGVQGQGLVQGNRIGTDVTGTLPLGNFMGIVVGTPLSVFNGDIQVSHPANLTIGGTAAGAGNVISGNRYGISVQNYQIFNIDPIPLAHPGEGTFVRGPSDLPQSVLIQGNRIGTDLTGNLAVGNIVGIQIVNFGSATIGGNVAGAGNIISGNFQNGLETEQSTANNLIQGNRIGTNAAGTAALPNGGAGVSLAGHSDTVGGITPGSGNVISGNTSIGLVISPQPSSFSLVFLSPLLLTGGGLIQGNLIGTDITGTLPLPNGGSGILVAGSSNAIGGVVSGAANTIAFNAGAGVAVVNYLDSSVTPPAITTWSGLNNTISANRIYGNGGLGIDLGLDGVTPNNPAGLPTGPNRLVPAPVIISVALSTGGGGDHGDARRGAFDEEHHRVLRQPLHRPRPDAVLFQHVRRRHRRRRPRHHQRAQPLRRGHSPDHGDGDRPVGRYLRVRHARPAGHPAPLATIAATTTTLIGPPAIAATGQPVPFAAVVAPNTPGGARPTGLVAFIEGSTVLGEVPLDANGVALFFTNTLPPGLNVVAAVYLGDSANANSLSNYVAASIIPPTPATILVGPSTSLKAGQAATFAVVVTASVPGAAVPTGLVALVEGGTVLGEVALNASGSALFATTALPVGQSVVAGVYLGDVHDAPALSNYVAVNVTSKPTKKPVKTTTKVHKATATASIPSGPRKPARIH